MMKQSKLAKARAYETTFGAQILPEERPLFHVTPTVGWLNDPNGFSVYQGEYHLFYQYHPYDIHWGPMHWGHMKSHDLIRWERLPAALAPDKEYDKNGVFSGSAVELPDGRHLLMYTGVQGNDCTSACRQTQCLAVGDGINYQKYKQNPVLTADAIPEPCYAKDFRDPKIWHEPEENCFFSVAGIRVQDQSGAVALFSSKDGFHWNFVNILDRSRNQYGRMWECPDFFELDEKAVLIVSPQEMQAQGLTFHGGNDVICLIGNYDHAEHQFSRETVTAVDYGLDFYAPQTLKTPDGRRVMIGWMQSWENSHLSRDNAKWQGMCTIPRELFLNKGQLIQNPIKELENYRRNPVICKELPFAPHTRLTEVSGRVLDLTIDVRPEHEASMESFTIYFAQDESYKTSISYNVSRGTVCLDRTDSGFRHNIVNRREAPVRNQGGKIRFRILLDRFSAEVFINDGEQVMSACIYTPQKANGISFEAKGSGRFDVKKYELVF